jgi:hypothetical protein
MSSHGTLGAGFAILEAVVAALIVVVVGLWMLWILPGRRKITGMLVTTLLPALLIASVFAGETRSPESITERRGTILAEALQAYRDDSGTYPETFAELVPGYLANLPEEPPFVWGWLYKVEEDRFFLGYVSYVDKLGYSVSFISSDSMEWQYRALSTGPFTLGPTPAP